MPSDLSNLAGGAFKGAAGIFCGGGKDRAIVLAAALGAHEARRRNREQQADRAATLALWKRRGITPAMALRALGIDPLPLLPCWADVESAMIKVQHRSGLR